MYIADLHIHSKYSRATSRDCDIPHLDFWARRKGIQLLGTGDFTHPVWRSELKEQLLPDGNGLYRLNPDFLIPDSSLCGSDPRFIITGEISSIYKKAGRVRKVHNVIILPGLEEAEILSKKLESIGNIHSDGRPILGLDSRDLLEITLESCPKAIFIPAHIWTPHFSLFGAFSGFDAIEECFEELTPYIHAVETGLSSDPPMNWRVSALDRFTLVSNSDAHSPQKLGREANLLDGVPSYEGLSKAIETGEGFRGTLEFFPEEGKYHLDGHRNCHLCLTPEETNKLKGKCPVCGKKLTIGVQHRVEELADRPEGFRPEKAKSFESLAPLPEVIAASTGLSAAGVRVNAIYTALLQKLGSEFYILRDAPLEDICREAGPCIEEGIRRLRRGQVERTPGYDGEFGAVSLLSSAEIESFSGQVSLFGPEKSLKRNKSKRNLVKGKAAALSDPKKEKGTIPLERLNAEQQQAITSADTAIAVIAGPGTGKTKTLVSRIAYLVDKFGVKPGEITAVTFTNQAAEEMRQRLEQLLGGKRAVRAMTIGTFHSICLGLLENVAILSETDALEIAAQIQRELDLKGPPHKFLQEISKAKNGLPFSESIVTEKAFEAYRDKLNALKVLDFDDLLIEGLKNSFPPRRCFSHLFIDEFQDINDLQYKLVLAWHKGGKSLFAIGDPDQSIYGFRGANSRCFDRLKDFRPELREIKLVQNYRSTPEILQCALSVISKNEGDKRLLTAHAASGVPVRLLTSGNDFSEAVFIAKEIARMTGGIDMLEADRTTGRRECIRSFSDIAILCRTYRQLDLIEKCLRHDSIPCLVFGRDEFLEDSEVRGVTAFFRWLLDPHDLLSLKNCLHLLWHCPSDLIDWAEKLLHDMEVLDISRLKSETEGIAFLSPWISRVEEYLPAIRKEKPYKLITNWTGNEQSSACMQKLGNMAVFYSGMPAFLDALLLGEENDLCRLSGKSYASGAVRLMTLHGAKGLEFPVVFLAGIKEGTLPLETSRYNPDINEERRLFFVGITRAREELILLTSQKPSLFLADLPQNGLLKESAQERSRPAFMEQLSLF